MNRYTVLTWQDARENLYWAIYDRVAGTTLHHKPSSKAEAWGIADSLNENEHGDPMGQHMGRNK